MMNRKKQLLSIIMSFCIIMASVTVGRVEVKALDMWGSTFEEVSGDDIYKKYYRYYYYADDDYDQNEKFTKDYITATEDVIKSGRSDGISINKEGQQVGYSMGSYTYNPTSDGLVFGYSREGDSYMGYFYTIIFTDLSVAPMVYFMADNDTVVELSLEDTADANGMVSTKIASSENPSDDIINFLSGLDIKVTKSVNKIEKGSFKIEITEKGNTANNYTDNFKYFSNKEFMYEWGNFINSDDSCLGGVENREVVIYIKPDNFIRAIASVNDENGGSISPEKEYYELSDTSDYDYEITINEGYEFKEVKVENSRYKLTEKESNNSKKGYTFNPSEFGQIFFSGLCADIKAYFEKKTYEVTVTQGENGTISPSSANVEHGESETFTITPNTGYQIKDVKVDDESVMKDVVLNGEIGTYTLSDVTQAQEITAEFEKKTYEVTVTQGENGTITPTSANVKHEESETFTITPDTGYQIKDVKVDDESVMKDVVLNDETATYTLSDVTQTHEITAEFEKKTYEVTVTQGENGTISPASANVKYEESETFTITPNTGYEIKDVKVDNISVMKDVVLTGETGTYTLSDVKQTHEITVEFEKKIYEVTVKQGENGIITPVITNVEHGKNEIFTIAPDTGYEIKDVKVDNISVMKDVVLTGETGTYTLSDVKQTHEITAEFTKKTYGVTVKQGENGTIAPESANVEHGENQTFTITPNTGYEIKDVIVNGESKGKVTSYTFENVTTNTNTITAEFEKKIYEVTVTQGENGTITPAGANIEYGEDQTFTITPDSGYEIKDVKVDDVSVKNDVTIDEETGIGTYTLSNVTQTHKITAEFIIKSDSSDDDNKDDDNKDDDSKDDDSKDDDNKDDDNKDDGSKDDDNKDDDSKDDDNKDDDSKDDDSKDDDNKDDDSKDDDNKDDDSKDDDKKDDDNKDDDSKDDDNKDNDNKDDDSKDDDKKDDDNKDDDSKEDGNKGDDSKDDDSKEDGNKGDDSKDDDSKEDGNKDDNNKNDGNKEDGSKDDNNKNDGNKEDGSKDDNNKNDGVKEEIPKLPTIIDKEVLEQAGNVSGEGSKEIEVIVDEKLEVNKEAVEEIIKQEKDLVINTENISLTINNSTFASEKIETKFEVSAEVLSSEKMEEIKNNINSDSNITELIVSKEISITADGEEIDLVNKEPLTVSVNISSDIKDTDKLTAVRYELQEDGSYKAVKIGGTYDAETNSFTYRTDKTGIIAIVKAEDVKQVKLTIGNQEMSVNGQNVVNDVAPVVEDDRTYLPIRVIAESLGAEVGWDQETQSVTVTLNGKTLKFNVNEEIDGYGKPLVKNERTLLPVRYISEQLGANVLWVPSTNEIEIVK